MSKTEALDKLLAIIDKSQALLPQILELNQEIKDLRQYTAVGDLITFSRGNRDANVLNSTMIEFDSLFDLKPRIREIKDVINAEEVGYAVGDIVTGTNFRTLTIDNIGHKVDVSGRMFGVYGESVPFIILDINGTDYTLVEDTYSKTELLFATKEQLKIYFVKENKKEKQNWMKIEFTINGVDNNYINKLKSIKLYTDPAREKTDKNMHYAWNNRHSTRLINYIVDEDFGVMGTAYIAGTLQSNYVDILFEFGQQKFTVGFSQTKELKEMYKYNGRISGFTKDKQSAGGTTYFPKDVFIGSTKQRIASITEITQIIEKESKETVNL